MGMDSTVELKVRTFSNAAKERVKRISLKDYKEGFRIIGTTY